MASPNIFLGFQKIGIGETWTIKSIKSQDHAGSKNQQIESSHSQQKHQLGPRSSDDWKSFLPKVVPNFRTQIVDDKQTLKRKGHWTCQNPPSLILKQRSKILEQWLKLKRWILKKGGSNPNLKNMGFPTKNDHFEVFWGYHHLRKHPSFFRCFKYFYLVPTIFGYFIFHIPRTHQQTPRPTVNILLDWPAKG